MTRSPIIAVLALALLAAPALACGNGECDPPPAKVEPPVAEPPVAEPPVPPPPAVEPPSAPLPTPDDGDPLQPYVAPHFAHCCQIEGRMYVRTAWLRDPVTALEQCRAREERLQSLPECPRRIRERAE